MFLQSFWHLQEQIELVFTMVLAFLNADTIVCTMIPVVLIMILELLTTDTLVFTMILAFLSADTNIFTMIPKVFIMILAWLSADTLFLS